VHSLNDYEMMFILPPDLEEEAAKGTTETVRNYVASRGGEIKSLEPWGRRRLAFPIERYHEGVYHIARFSMSPEHALDLDRSLRLNEQVIRHMIVRVE
jgi:small subunit ribosomal protein S6